MQGKRHWLILVVTMTILLCALFALRHERLQPTLVVGIDPTFPPFASREADGQLVGFEVELVRYLASGLDSRLELKEIPFRDLLASLQSGTVQLVVSGMPIRPDRQQLADFSQPYYDATQVVVVRSTETRSISCPKDLANWRLGVLTGTTGEFEAVAIKGDDTEKSLMRMNEVAAMFTALSRGEVQALFVDKQLAQRYVAGDSTLRMVSLDFWEEKYAVAVQKGQLDLLQRVEAALSAWMESPAYEQALAQWLGPDN